MLVPGCSVSSPTNPRERSSSKLSKGRLIFPAAARRWRCSSRRAARASSPRIRRATSFASTCRRSEAPWALMQPAPQHRDSVGDVAVRRKYSGLIDDGQWTRCCSTSRRSSSLLDRCDRPARSDVRRPSRRAVSNDMVKIIVGRNSGRPCTAMTRSLHFTSPERRTRIERQRCHRVDLANARHLKRPRRLVTKPETSVRAVAQDRSSQKNQSESASRCASFRRDPRCSFSPGPAALPLWEQLHQPPAAVLSVASLITSTGAYWSDLRRKARCRPDGRMPPIA